MSELETFVGCCERRKNLTSGCVSLFLSFAKGRNLRKHIHYHLHFLFMLVICKERAVSQVAEKVELFLASKRAL